MQLKVGIDSKVYNEEDVEFRREEERNVREEAKKIEDGDDAIGEGRIAEKSGIFL